MTINLARALIRKEGIRVDLVLGKAEGPYVKDIPPGVRLIDLKKDRMRSAVLPLARYLSTEKPDALVSGLDYANVAAVIAAALSAVSVQTMVVTHIHLSSALAHLSRSKRLLVRFMLRQTYPRAKVIVAVSHGVATDLAQLLRVPMSRIRVIYNPVVDQELMIQAQEPVNHPWLSTPSHPVVVAVGRLTEQKDFATLLRACALLKRHTEVRLVILGEGEERAELEQLVAELGLDHIVDMPGFVPNPYSYMLRATVVALSSRWEALPTVLIEAMSCGVPVVSTDCPSGPHEVLAGGKYGRLVPVGDAEAMAAALLDAVQGRLPAGPPESWAPYSVESATSEYLRAFALPDRNCFSEPGARSLPRA